MNQFKKRRLSSDSSSNSLPYLEFGNHDDINKNELVKQIKIDIVKKCLLQFSLVDFFKSIFNNWERLQNICDNSSVIY